MEAELAVEMEKKLFCTATVSNLTLPTLNKERVLQYKSFCLSMSLDPADDDESSKIRRFILSQK